MTLVWVRLETVIALQAELLVQHGGLSGLRDRGALESALQRPQNLVLYEGVEDHSTLAAAYLVGVAKAHAFADANKRTAWTTAALFLELNGTSLDYEPAAALRMVVGAAESSLDLKGVTDWVRSHSRAR